MSGNYENVSVVPNQTVAYPNTTTPQSEECQWHLPPMEWLKIAMLTFGFLGNGATTFILIVKKDLHSKTYATIGAIALSDFLYCLGGFLWGVLYYAYMDPNDFRSLQSCISEFFNTYLKDFLQHLMTSAYLSSGIFIAVLSVFRYIIIVYPLKANIILTKRVVIVTFAFVYVLSIAYSVLQHTKVIKDSIIYRPLDTFLSYLLPLCVMVVFHTLKLSQLKKNTFQTTKNSVRKMEVVVVMVVMAFFLLLLPWHVLTIGFEFGLLKPGYSAVTASAFLLQLNNCINPVFYAFLSPNVRRNLCFCCHRKEVPTRRNPTATQSTTLNSSSSCSTQTTAKRAVTPSSVNFNSSTSLNSSAFDSSISTDCVSSDLNSSTSKPSL